MNKQPSVVGVINLLDTLTEREHEVFDLVFAGSKRTEIAAALSLTESGVKYHLDHIYEKLNVRGRAEAVAYAASVVKVAEVVVVGREAKQYEVLGCGSGWDEAAIREAALRLIKKGCGDRKVVNEVVADLLLALNGHI